MKDIVLWLYWYPFRFLVHYLPASAVYRLAGACGTIAYFLHGGRRNLLEQELSRFSGDMPDRQARTIVKNAFINYFQNEIEVLLYSTLNAGNIDRFVACSGLDYIDAALGRGRGVMLLFGHFGANQMVMPAIGYHGYTMCQMSAPATVWVEKMPNRKFSAMEKKALAIRWNQELSLPVRHINIFGPLKAVYACLKKNEVLGIAADGGGGRDRVAVPFLGRTAYFSPGALEIAKRTGCAVLPVFMIRNKSGHHTMIVERPLEFDAAGPEMVTRSLTRFVERLEHYVRKYPCHYLNFLGLRKKMELQDDTPFFKTADPGTLSP
jgi:KDO2-lipid IV(A) lauroyltransferase